MQTKGQSNQNMETLYQERFDNQSLIGKGLCTTILGKGNMSRQSAGCD